MDSFSAQHNGLLRLGTKAENIYRMLLRFDLSAVPCSSRIIRGTLNIYLEHNDIADPPQAIGAFQVLSDWSPKKLVWTRQPLINSLPVDTISVMTLDSAFISLNITSLVQEWLTNRSANLGIMLKFLDECDSGLVAIPGRRYGDSRFWPYLELNLLNSELAGSPMMLRATPLNLSVNVTTQNFIQTTAAVDILTYDYSYIVVNTGANPAQAALQSSPDSTNWQNESAAKIIFPGTVVSFVPNTIARYARLAYLSQNAGQATSLTVYTQGRTYD
jgi:hypothetical protein